MRAIWKESEPVYYYQFTAGTAEFGIYGGDDRKARRLLARWLRLAWPKFQARTRELHPGSMADAENNGWHRLPEARIYRASICPAGIIQREPWPCIERFELCAETIAEFNRSYGGR